MMISSYKSFETSMSLGKEEAPRRADQIIQEAEQTSIHIRNVKAKPMRTPLLDLFDHCEWGQSETWFIRQKQAFCHRLIVRLSGLLIRLKNDLGKRSII